MASKDDTGPNNQLRRYIERVLLNMMENQRTLIQAQTMGQEGDRQLRQELQGSIVSAYQALKPYKSRNPNKWDSAVLYDENGDQIEGLDNIQKWPHMTDRVEYDKDDFKGGTETITRKRIHSADQLISTATTVAEVADKIGFNAIPDDSKSIGET